MGGDRELTECTKLTTSAKRAERPRTPEPVKRQGCPDTAEHAESCRESGLERAERTKCAVDPER